MFFRPFLIFFTVTYKFLTEKGSILGVLNGHFDGFWRVFQDPKLIENRCFLGQNHPKSTAITSNHPQIHLQYLQTPLGVHRNHARVFFGIFHFFFPFFSSFFLIFLLCSFNFFYFFKMCVRSRSTCVGVYTSDFDFFDVKLALVHMKSVFICTKTIFMSKKPKSEE